MYKYKKTIRDKTSELFDRSFNHLNFELLKAGVGEDSILDYIERPTQSLINNEWYDSLSKEEIDEKIPEAKEKGLKTEKALKDYLFDVYTDEVDEWWSEQEHYPMWSTIFEAKDDFLSDKIMSDIDELYKLGIGVIAPTDYTNACLFIAGAGYDFYDAHWIPLFKHWNWLKE